MRGMLAIPCLSLLFVSPLAAVEKPPWRWTAEERARVRMDPAQREARITEHRQRARARGLDPGSDGPVGDIIDGNVHPELFYTTELFEKLVRSAFVTLPKVYPRVIRDRSSDLFQSASEWERFAEIVSDFAT